MKIALFGSTGPVGQLVIKHALDKGYDVVAFARNPSRLTIKSEKLQIVQGELNDDLSVEKAVSGVNAVISTLGPLGNDKRNSELGDGYLRIIASMKKHNIKRIIALGTASVKDGEDKGVFKFRLLVAVVKRIIPGSYKEIVRIGSIVRNTELDWTLIRVAILTNGTATGKIRSGYYGKTPIGLMVSRDDLAKFFIDQVEEIKFIQKAPAVSN
jgi:putative NADH-flavin reductase